MCESIYTGEQGCTFTNYTHTSASVNMVATTRIVKTVKQSFIN